MGGQIFINYRRDDSSASAGRLYDRLNSHFASNQIFIDVDNLAPGVDFVEAIEESVGSCDVLIAVIGRRWLISSDEEGRRRLDNPDDFVRIEIATALKRKIRVIPVLVEGASMPLSRVLPDDLKPLVRRNALEISHTRFNGDCDRLIGAVERVLESARTEQERKREEKERLDAEQRERDEKERLEAERRQRGERDRLETGRQEREEKERLEAERRGREQKEQLEAERRDREEKERLTNRGQAGGNFRPLKDQAPASRSRQSPREEKKEGVIPGTVKSYPSLSQEDRGPAQAEVPQIAPIQSTGLPKALMLKAAALVLLVSIVLGGIWFVASIMNHGKREENLVTPAPTAQPSPTPMAQPSPTPTAQPSIAKGRNFDWKPGIGVLGARVTVQFAGASDVGEDGRWTRAVTEEWAKKTGNTLEYISRPNDTTATLQQYQQYWAAKSPDIDVFMIDVIWQGIAAPHAVDMKKYYKEDEIKAFFPRIIQNNTVGSKLVSIPWFTDAGLLYYRTDLLDKYGYKEPPKTWEELADMAKKIQDGERKEGNAEFQGFVFQGKASESVTCNAIEWVYSFGGGNIVEPNKKVTINNPHAIKALETAKSWVGTISPLGVIAYGEEEARNIWQAGNAAFMRNWPYAYALGADAKSAVSGKFDVTVLPKGGDNGKNAACLGGWQLMVSAYSKVPDAAADLVKYLTCAEVQKKHAIDISMLPTQPALYSDPEVLAQYPYFKNILPVLENAVARPSTVTGADYNQLSTAFFQNVNKVLTGGTTAQDAVSKVERVAKRIVP